MGMKAFQFRLYPTKSQAEQLQWRLDRYRELYNACLEERREAWRQGKILSFYDQRYELLEVKEVRSEYRDLGSQILEDVVRRVDLAYQAFFRRRKQGDKSGFPRFKGRDRYNSFTLRQRCGWKLSEGRLVISKIGSIKVRWSRNVQGSIKTVTIKRSVDQWYVCFSCDLGNAEPYLKEGPSIGIDVGLEAFATLSDGTRIENPRYYRQGEEVLAQRQRRLSLKNKGSKRRAKARLLVAKAHRKTRDQRKDFHHKASKKLVDQFALIGVEDLNIKNMVKNRRLAKSISDAGWAQFLSMIEYKAEWAGAQFVKVNPSGTSQTCLCGERVEKDLSVRHHNCAACGLSLPRDQVSAMLILARAEPSGVAA